MKPPAIRALRKRLGLSQEQFAAELGVSFVTVNRWENGHTKPSPMAMKQITRWCYDTLKTEMQEHE